MDIATLRALKGAPLSTLIALMLIGHAGPIALSEWTGYDRKVTATALRTLERMRYAEATGSRGEYRLMPTFQQLPLLTPSDMPASSGENLPTRRSSSSFKRLSETREQLLPPTTNGENLPTHASPRALDQARLFSMMTGASQQAAAAKFAELEQSGETWPEYEIRWRRWLGFALDRPNITNPGAYVLSRCHLPAPANVEPYGRRDYIQHLRAQCKENDLE